MVKFYVGLHRYAYAHWFDRSFISVNVLRRIRRLTGFSPNDWIMDSGAFTEVARFGGYRYGVDEYARQIRRCKNKGNLVAAVAQDYMCERFVLDKVGGTVVSHQMKTIDRYDALLGSDIGCVYIMPVLQGQTPVDYVMHMKMYGSRLAHGAYVGVGSVCKRNGNPGQVRSILRSIKCVRPDLKLHGFGLKYTALTDRIIRSLLYSCDSMAWSFMARKQGRDQNDPREAIKYENKVLELIHT